MVLCNGAPCSAQADGFPMCADCVLNRLFKQMYEECDPLQCRQIKCVGCELYLNANKLIPEENDWSI